ncbi:YPO3983 family protein [Kosakonia sp. 1610]|jgi:uncharacterized protein (TIGR03034 family)|uniref:YPO3983 family protein n=1 Tax=Kosakonia sp. 1610 TaxID=3156426 RepID=UPI003D1C6EA2
MVAQVFPTLIFKTQKTMDDYGAPDMRYGDLSEQYLKNNLHMFDISSRINPYTLQEINPLRKSLFMHYGSRSDGRHVTLQECAAILFDEFRFLSGTFSIYSNYQHLIKKMITHMQTGNGLPFCNTVLNTALREQILSDKSALNSSRLLLKQAIQQNIDWTNQSYPAERVGELSKAISFSKLPKFDRFKDSFNGMGITVHDTWATHITVKSLYIDGSHYRAEVHYKIQDHFGLDITDISKFKFNQFRFFRIWFMLQRYERFGYKPFMTNMETTIEIVGERNES